jgi:tRNA(fMet)-specific endonuclease VapC
VGSNGSDFDKRMLSIMEVVNFDDKQAAVASRIYKNLKMRNQLVEFRDIFIASCAIEKHFVLATLNKKHFEMVDEVSLYLS